MEKTLIEELEYPFDSELLLRKQKAIKRELLAREGVSYTKKRIAVLNGSTTADIVKFLEIFLLRAGIQPVFYESAYNKYYEEAVFGSSELDDFQPEIVIVFTTSANLLYAPTTGDSDEAAAEKLEQEYLRFEQIWKVLSARYGALVIQNNMELPCFSSLGNLEAVLPQGTHRFIGKLNERFAAYAAGHENFALHDIHGLASSIGLRKWHDRSQYHAYKLAMSYDLIPEVAHSLTRLLLAALGRSRKCLVLDLDNTLWGGIIGDDGVEGLQMGMGSPRAEAYTEFQSYVKALKERGVLLAVCSKNEEEIAKSGFSHQDCLLKLDDFVAFYANWEPKDKNLRAMAAELNIGLDSFVFIDDNPAERSLVRESLPEVAVPEVNPEDVSSYIRAIEGAGYFEQIAISQDDKNRSRTYMENKQRKALQESMASYEDFLQSLEMKAEIAPFCPACYERVAQLAGRSNQFNLTTRRFTASEVREMAEDSRYITLYGRLSDKFGDNGLISAVIGERKGQELHISLWIMSCRVFKRGMEYAMLDALAKAAKAAGLTKLVGYYFKTKKNKIVESLYEDFHFQKRSQDGEDAVWELALEDYQPGKYFIEVEGGSGK